MPITVSLSGDWQHNKKNPDQSPFMVQHKVIRNETPETVNAAMIFRLSLKRECYSVLNIMTEVMQSWTQSLKKKKRKLLGSCHSGTVVKTVS